MADFRRQRWDLVLENHGLDDDKLSEKNPQSGGAPDPQLSGASKKPKSLLDWNIEESVAAAAPGLTSKEKLLLKFMEMTIERINTCLVNLHAVQELLIKKGVCSQDEIKAAVSDARNLPETKVGKQVLDEMIRDFNAAAEH